jgi:hypothetical protein
MIQKIKKNLVLITASLFLLVPALAMSSASADTTPNDGAGTNVASGLCSGINSAAGNAGSSAGASCGTDGNGGSSTLETIASRIVNLFSIIVGIAAVFMIVYGGFRYITSGGDSGRVGNAKNTLIYAIVGLIIVALAQVIVHFVLNQASQADAAAASLMYHFL